MSLKVSKKVGRGFSGCTKKGLPGRRDLNGKEHLPVLLGVSPLGDTKELSLRNIFSREDSGRFADPRNLLAFALSCLQEV